MVDYKKDKYIILELIPDGIDPDKGIVLQVSALKLNGLELVGRFDYRINEDKIRIKEFLEMLNYDKENFTYVDDDKIIMDELKNWVSDLPLLLLDDTYTLNFLNDFDNSKELIFDLYNLEYTSDVFEKIMGKYNLESSNYLVDLLYEALIYESNN